MQTITIEVPDIIWESHGQNVSAVREEVRRGLVIWEYLNGHLTIGECGEILRTGYRGFLELLWNRGIPVDALSDDELEHQLYQLREIADT